MLSTILKAYQIVFQEGNFLHKPFPSPQIVLDSDLFKQHVAHAQTYHLRLSLNIPDELACTFAACNRIPCHVQHCNSLLVLPSKGSACEVQAIPWHKVS